MNPWLNQSPEPSVGKGVNRHPGPASFGARGSGRQQLPMRIVVAVPTNQGLVAGVFEQMLERQPLGMAIAKNHVGIALVAVESIFEIAAFHVGPTATLEDVIAIKTIPDREHVTGNGYFRFCHRRGQRASGGHGISAQTKRAIISRRG